MKILVFEGCDKSGKSTLIREVHKATNYKYIITDRFTPSSITYGKYRNRKLNYDEYYEIEKKLSDDVILFYITASNDSIKKRIVSENEKDITSEDIMGLKREYVNYLCNTHFIYFVIDTTNRSIKSCVNDIIRDIKKVENRNGIYQISNLYCNVETHGKKVNNTKELTNISIEFKDLTLRALNDYCLKNDIDFNETNRSEKFYYDRLYHSIRHIIKAQLTEYKQNVNSRRFVFTSNECINSYHCLFRDDLLEVFINLRSSNVEKILPFDVYHCKLIANKINKEFFKAKKIRCYFTINSAHIYI